MHDVSVELKALRLHGMASAWSDLMAHGTSATASSRWLIDHLLEAETTDRAMRIVSSPPEGYDDRGARSRSWRTQDRNAAIDHSPIRRTACREE